MTIIELQSAAGGQLRTSERVGLGFDVGTIEVRSSRDEIMDSMRFDFGRRGPTRWNGSNGDGAVILKGGSDSRDSGVGNPEQKREFSRVAV